jgi:hypothetical protein
MDETTNAEIILKDLGEENVVSNVKDHFEIIYVML